MRACVAIALAPYPRDYKVERSGVAMAMAMVHKRALKKIDCYK